ncbi:putative transcriptional regulator [Candidatus Methanoperedens nitroreducens]|uniref:Putative transcriptional regulator n=1 Tax=Candidatus Methanoperedens nitratireducens TaxID=1392998 RepID=A0A062V1U2_9EURY|nr:winged helix-turn-helix domain-containing protein [Candidatus Methanoperedens nitroreducens]KCZ71332.1 putative transcriptional regulator [Candidatus Methanoperedens nitroreducens]MDJ1420961.1 winged helix-turn-helix domain-containing protein [Candidatus Methanoperedens sp.]
MGIYTNKKIEEYANEMPLELKRAIEALNDDFRLAIFFVLFKYGELSFSQIMTELEIPRKDSSILSHHLKILEKGALIENEYAKKEGIDSHSFYDLTEFGEDVLKGLMHTLAVPHLDNEPIEPLKELLYRVGLTQAEKAFKRGNK